jgi:serine/threonine protein kinase
MSSRRIGNYQITDYIGGGGFGSVFKAEDANTPGRVVAIKELHKKHTRNQIIKQRFFQEAVAMARLDHPNLPRLYTFGEDNGSYYLVMELISGKLLSDEIHDGGPMPPARAVGVLTQMLDAVSYAHRNGIIHRDLKPDNIILVENGGALRVKVLDFGIARMIGGESLTLAGEGFGTPSYMAPERMSGAAGDDPRMDLYAAGMILYEMLTGKTPFESKATDPALYWAEMRDLHQRGPLPALATLGVSGELERVASRATAKRLEDRYQSADAMLDDLKRLNVVCADAPTALLNSSRLQLSTSPVGAEVYVDDRLRGTSDVMKGKILIDGLTPGLHSVRVLREGYNEYKINVALEEGGQTDLQVALAARATIEMPRAADTAAGGFETLKLQGADEIKTAVLVVESLPAGSTVFIGSEAVAHAGEDGRATLRLAPGSHEIRAATPTGSTAPRVVSVTAQDAGSLKTMTLPLPQTTAISEAPPARDEQSRRGKQIAAAAVVILLLALAAGAFFVLRGPARNRTRVESASVASGAAPALQDASKAAPSTAAEDEQKASEDRKKAAEERRKAEQDLAAIEAQKKAAEKAQDKAEKKDATPQEPRPAVPSPQPTLPAAQPADAGTASGPGRNACVVVTVTDVDGQPVPRVRVELVEQPDSAGAAFFNGRTGEMGRWQNCGLAPGHQIRVDVLGPRGGVLATRMAVVTRGRNFIGIGLQRKLDEKRELMPKRNRPFSRQP